MVHEYNDPGCRRMSELNLAGFLPRSEANGPGIRAVVWVQGCPIRCKGCFNRSSWSFSPAVSITARELADRILSVQGIDGVTFSGGEPFAQARPLADVAEQVRQTGLTVVTYSGYTFGNLKHSRDPEWKRLLAATDLLIAGPYRADLTCSAPFIGSANQQVIPLSGRIALQPESLQHRTGETVEFTIAPDGTVTTSGFPSQSMVKQMAARCRGV